MCAALVLCYAVDTDQQHIGATNSYVHVSVHKNQQSIGL